MINSEKQCLLKKYKDKTVLACSYSQLESFLTCPHKWARLYIDGERNNTVQTDALLVGGHLHKTFEVLENKKKNNEVMECSSVEEDWHKIIYDTEIPFATEEAQQLAYDLNLNTMKLFCDNKAELTKLMDGLDIIGIEEEFFFPLKLGFEVEVNGEKFDEIYLNGAIDLTLEDFDGTMTIVDHKSSKKLFDKKKLTTNLQFPIYCLAKIAMVKEPITEFKCWYHFTKFNQLQEVVITPERLKETKSELRQIFRDMYTTKKYHQRLSPLCDYCDFSKDDSCIRGRKLVAMSKGDQKKFWEW